jgi:hypothetical protein
MKKDPDKITPFTFVDQICLKSKKNSYDKKVASAYFLCLHFSFFRDLVKVVDKVLPYLYTLGDEAVYDYLWHSIPKGSRFIRWPKKKQEETLDLGIAKLKEKHPDLSKREARMIVSFYMNKMKRKK